MATQIFVDPEKVRKTGKLTFKDIPVIQNNETLESEKQNFTKSELIFLYKSMVIIRDFESMLLSVRTAGEYKSISYEYTGPAHLSIGQEAAAVGQAFLLNQDDFIFGSHRSHGEIIAKGMSAIRKLAVIKLA